MCAHACVKQGFPCSPTLFGLCRQMVTKFVKEGVENVVIRNVVIILLLCVDEVVLFIILKRCAKAYEGIGRICMHTQLSVNS